MNVVTMREPSTVSSVRDTVCSEMPRSAARLRSTATLDLRLALFVVRLDVGQRRVLAHALHQQVAPLDEVGVLRALQHDLHGRAAAATAEAARHRHEAAHAWNAG